jgi:hypothetical protein
MRFGHTEAGTLTVAIEYCLKASPVMSVPMGLAYFADMLDCDERFEVRGEVRRAVRKDFAVSVLHVAEDGGPLAALLGTGHLLHVGFRLAKHLSPEADAVAFRDIVAAAARFFEDFPDAKGALSFQNEELYLQRVDGDGIVMADRLLGPDYNRDGVLDGLLANYPVGPLGDVDDLFAQ